MIGADNGRFISFDRFGNFEIQLDDGPRKAYDFTSEGHYMIHTNMFDRAKFQYFY